MNRTPEPSLQMLLFTLIAWVIWIETNHPGFDTHYWRRSDRQTFATRAECEEMVAGVMTLQYPEGTRIEKLENGFVVSMRPDYWTRWGCWPDTVDPSGGVPDGPAIRGGSRP